MQNSRIEVTQLGRRGEKACRKATDIAPTIRVANYIEEGRFAGPQRRIADVAMILGKHGIETTVIYSKYDSKRFARELEERGIKNIPLPVHRLTRERSHLVKYVLRFPYEVFLLFRLFRKEQFDLIHCSGGAWQFKGVIAGKLAGVKTIWHLNDTSQPKSIFLLFKAISLLCADAFIVAGSRVKACYFKKYKTNRPIFEIPPPVDTRSFRPDVVKPDLEMAELEGVKIVSIANINPYKGFETFIEMASMVSTMSDISVQFCIVGEMFKSQEPYVLRLKALAHELGVTTVHFLGKREDVRSSLKAADIYVCSSIAEAGPMSVWEAMSMKKAIVSTDVGDVAKYVRDSECGFVVPVGDSKSMADKVVMLIQDEHLRQTFGTKARNRAIQYLDVHGVADKHEQCYRRLKQVFGP